MNRPMVAVLMVLGGVGAARADAQRLPRVRIETTAGVIEAEIDTVHAPITARNFLAYVDRHFYDHGLFHRTVTLGNQPDKLVKIEVIQAAGDTSRAADGQPPITLERTSLTGLRHKAGTLSMARAGIDTAQDQFFICVTDQPELDFGGKRNPDGQGFAAFGKVLAGMDVVKKIQQSPAKGQTLTPAIGILRVTRR